MTPRWGGSWGGTRCRLDIHNVYVGNNPVNLVDPAGLLPCPLDPRQCEITIDDIVDCAADPIGCARETISRAVHTAHAADVALAENLFGQAVNLLSSGDRREPKEGGFVIVEDCRGLCSVILKLGGNPNAITLGRYVFSSHPRIAPRTERHEAVHVEQYSRYGLGGFLFRYFVVETVENLPGCRWDVGCYYWWNDLEEEARERARQ